MMNATKTRQHWANRAVGIAAPIVFLFSLAGAAVSLLAGWPHQFGAVGSRENILREFVTSGPPPPRLFVSVRVWTPPFMTVAALGL